MKCLLCGAELVSGGKICLSCSTKTEGKVCFVKNSFFNFIKKRVLIMDYSDVCSLFGEANAEKHIHFLPKKYFDKLLKLCDITN